MSQPPLYVAKSPTAKRRNVNAICRTIFSQAKESYERHKEQEKEYIHDDDDDDDDDDDEDIDDNVGNDDEKYKNGKG